MTILEGGGTESERTFVGVAFELRADFGNKSLRLHDGSKEGGFEFLNRDVMSTMFQAKNSELTAVAGFNDENKGFMIRVSAGSYAFRKLQSDTNNITITNTTGIAGNPYIELANHILSDHVFDGEVEFTQVIIAADGLMGDTEGTHTGDVVGNLTGNVTGNLTGNSTGSHTGGVDVRGASLQLDDGQIAQSKIAGLAAALAGISAVPLGAIIMWGGVIDEIPAGWQICDGSNGSPDLRAKFVMGAGGDIEPGDAGGTTTHTHTTTLEPAGAHVHNGTIGGTSLTAAQMPSHRHINGVCDDNASDFFNLGGVAASPASAKGIDAVGNAGVYSGYTSYTGSTTPGADGSAHTHSATIDSSGSHTHTSNVGSSNNLPPYIALCYIIFLGE